MEVFETDKRCSLLLYFLKIVIKSLKVLEDWPREPVPTTFIQQYFLLCHNKLECFHYESHPP
jgi:hypothetical protein